MASASWPWSASEPGVDDAALGHEGGAGRRVAQVLPQLLHPSVAAQGAVAVGQDRVLLGAAGEIGERLELGDRLLPAPESVEGEAQQLAHGHGGGCRFGDRSQDLAGLLVALPAEGLPGLLHPLVGALELGRRDRLAERRVRGTLALLHGGRRPARSTSADRALRLLDDLALVDPDLGLPRAARRGAEGVGCRTGRGRRVAPSLGVTDPPGALPGHAAPARLLALGVVGAASVGPALPRRPLPLGLGRDVRARGARLGRTAGAGAAPSAGVGEGAWAWRGDPIGGPKTTKDPCCCRGPSQVRTRRRPTLPGPLDPSTIGAGGLNFRVRNGNGWDPSAMATEICCQVSAARGSDPWRSSLQNSIASTSTSVDPSPRPISTGRLNTLLCVHLRPINVMVYHGPYLVDPVGNLILERASYLDAFSTYPFRRSLISGALGRTTDTRELRPSRSSRTRDSLPQVSSGCSG